MREDDRPEWRLPKGVSRGVWQYAHADHIADQYDEYFTSNRLFEFDEQLLARYVTRPGLVVDLGCGTGRAVIALARRGFRCLGVDLSLPMLRTLGRKAREEGLSIHRLCANLVELDGLAADSADYCICLFSTLGMIRGRANRRRMLAHACRLLKPGGLFVVHVHNFWFNLFDAAGRSWLLRHLASSTLRRELERGDRFFDYRGIPRMYVHTFGQRELRADLRASGFRLVEWVPLDVDRQRPLRHRWLLGSIRANGWIAVCRKSIPSDRPSKHFTTVRNG